MTYKMLSAMHVPCVVATSSGANFVDALGNGDPIVVAIFIGWIGGLLLGFIAARAKAMDEATRMPPAEILIEVKKRRFRDRVATIAFLPLLGLGIVSDVFLKAPFLLGILFFLAFFQAMFFGELRNRCPGMRSPPALRVSPSAQGLSGLSRSSRIERAVLRPADRFAKYGNAQRQKTETRPACSRRRGNGSRQSPRQGGCPSGSSGRIATEDRNAVTCRKCLALLHKLGKAAVGGGPGALNAEQRPPAEENCHCIR